MYHENCEIRRLFGEAENGIVHHDVPISMVFTLIWEKFMEGECSIMFKYSVMHALARLDKDELSELEEGQHATMLGGFPTSHHKPVREMIYYEKFPDGSVATVVILTNTAPTGGDEPIVARGISVCAPVDGFSRAVGRILARGRAIRAAEKGVPSSLTSRVDKTRNRGITIPHCEGLKWVYEKFEGYKSSVFPDLTEKEKKILESSKVREGGNKMEENA